MYKAILASLFAFAIALMISAGCSSEQTTETSQTETHSNDDGHDHGKPAEQPVEPAPGGAQPSNGASAEPVAYMEDGKIVCPVMKGVEISNTDGKKYQDYEGVRYYFCCDGCPEKFAADPAKYAAKSE